MWQPQDRGNKNTKMLVDTEESKQHFVIEALPRKLKPFLKHYIVSIKLR
jgi:hypothetical protein